jgi:aspartyl-tRNA(Asn)/glutamyl-tRNA(Gln) amidotransferase subunit C
LLFAVAVAKNSQMRITDKDVLYVADLANLELTAEERERMVRDLNSILEYINRLNELKTTDVPPMAETFIEAGAGSVEAAGVLREDELRPSLPHQAAVANAPDSDGAFFKVPKVIER